MQLIGHGVGNAGTEEKFAEVQIGAPHFLDPNNRLPCDLQPDTLRVKSRERAEYEADIDHGTLFRADRNSPALHPRPKVRGR